MVFQAERAVLSMSQRGLYPNLREVYRAGRIPFRAEACADEGVSDGAVRGERYVGGRGPAGAQ